MGHYVTRARAGRVYESEPQVVDCDSSVHSFGRTATGFVVGQGGLKLRVYDKLLEAHKDLQKVTAVIQSRWGYFPFQGDSRRCIRRERLKEFNADTVEDWFEKRADICEYLCTSWFRLTNGPVDRNHADRCETLAEWLSVTRAFAVWTGEPSYAAFVPLAKHKYHSSHLIQQIVGLLISYFARTGNHIDSNEMFVDEAIDVLNESIDAHDMPARIWRRVLELGLNHTVFEELENE